MPTCCIAGCSRPASRHTTLCRPHVHVRRRWGHAQQAPLTQGEMKRATAHVRKLIDSRSNGADLWVKLRAALGVIRGEAEGLRRELKPGLAVMGSTYGPAMALLSVFEEVEEETIILTAVGIGWIAANDDRRFRSDDAFFASLGRRVLMLARSNYDRHTHPSTGKPHQSLRTFKPKTVIAVGRKMAPSFAAFGMRLQALEVTDQDRAREAKIAPLMALQDNP